MERGHLPETSRPSPKELEVLQAISDGYTDPLIARKMGITRQTVKRHVTNVRNRLLARNRTQAVAIAIRSGFIH